MSENVTCLLKIYKMEKLRTATHEDFKIGTELIDSEYNKFVLRNKYDTGIWECKNRVHFENEASHYRVSCEK